MPVAEHPVDTDSVPEMNEGLAVIDCQPFAECIGGPCRIRTYDQRIKSPLLYQLS